MGSKGASVQRRGARGQAGGRRAARWLASALLCPLALACGLPGPTWSPAAAPHPASPGAPPARVGPAGELPPLRPAARAWRVDFLGWSPSGRLLLYRELAPGEAAAGPGASPGSLVALDPESGAACPLPGGAVQARWLFDDSLLLEEPGGLRRVHPCQADLRSLPAPQPLEGVLALSPAADRAILPAAGHLWLLDLRTAVLQPLPAATRGASAASWSPGARHLALERPGGGTIFLDGKGAAVLAEVPWWGWQPEAARPPLWIGEERVLVPHTADAGPLLLDPGGGRVDVAGELFGLHLAPSREGPRALGAAHQPGGFHLVLTTGLHVSESLHLYHSESGRVESLPDPLRLWPAVVPGGYSPESPFSPDGGWLALYVGHPQGEQRANELWLRAVEGEARLRVAAGPPLRGAWSPRSTHLAAARRGRLILLRLQGGEWQLETGEAALAPLAWSPDGRLLALSAGEGELLLLELEQAPGPSEGEAPSRLPGR